MKQRKTNIIETFSSVVESAYTYYCCHIENDDSDTSQHKIDPKTKHKKNHIKRTRPNHFCVSPDSTFTHAPSSQCFSSVVSREERAAVKRETKDKRQSHRIMLLSKERRREMKNPIQKRVLEGTKRARKKKPPRRVFSPLLLLCLLLPPFRSPSFSSLSLSLSRWRHGRRYMCARCRRFLCAFFSSLLK